MKTINFQTLKIATIFLTLFLGIAFITNCGKDKTLSDYHQKKVDEAMVQLQSVAGVYRGSIVDSRDKSDMGDLEIELNAKATPINSDDNTTTAAQAVLQGKISIFNQTQSNVVIQKANYFWGDSVSSTNFNGTVTVPLTDGTSATLTITGRVAGNQFNGEISPDNKFGIKGLFKLTKNASFARPHKQDDTSPKTIAVYQGEFKDPYCNLGRDRNGVDKCLNLVTLNVQNITTNLGENFLNNFFLERNVAITLSLIRKTNDLPMNAVNFPKAVIDLQNGVLTAHGAYSGTINSMLDLNCNAVTGEDKVKGWACTFKSQFNGRTHTFTVFPVPLTLDGLDSDDNQ